MQKNSVSSIEYQSTMSPVKVVQDELEKVSNLVEEQLNCCDQAVKPVIDAFTSNRGKMIRPALLLICSFACSDKITDQHITAATVIEMIHNATLLHDDVLDNGMTRRGLPTVNSLFGNEAAVLLGDFVLTRVFNICVSLPANITEIIAHTTQTLCLGELKQIVCSRNSEIDEPEYFDIITRKTASLFTTCCELGAILSGADETDTRALGSYGTNIGMAFQITDDLLDIVGSQERTGKTVGSDAGNNRLTLPVIHYLSNNNSSVAEKDIKNFIDDPSLLIEELFSSGSIDYTIQKAEQFSLAAIENLNGICESDAKKALIDLAEFVLARKK